MDHDSNTYGFWEIHFTVNYTKDTSETFNVLITILAVY